MTQNFKLTPRQQELRAMFSRPEVENFLVYGGSRSGKTFFIIYTLIVRALKAPGSRHVVFRADGVDAKNAIGGETVPEVVRLAFPGLKLHWNDQKGCFTFPNGSELWLAGLKDKARLDKVLGREYASIYLNEASNIGIGAAGVVITRLAQTVVQVDGLALRQCLYVDLNPTTKTHWTYRMWVDGVDPVDNKLIDLSKYAMMRVNPADNADNLSSAYMARLRSLPEAQRRRFWDGEFGADNRNAIWRRSWIKRTQADLPVFQRIVVAVDPAVTNEPGSDETGIIVAGVTPDQDAYVLADGSGRHRPEEWARRAVSLYDQFEADRIVAEVNQGGDMVENMLRSVRPNIPYTAVRATRGKVIRAEPVAALYEQGKVFHAEEFPVLEDQMANFTVGFDRVSEGYSPDRVDALVWAMTELFPAVVSQQRREIKTYSMGGITI